MNYFISENIKGNMTAGSKARDDVSYILKQNGWIPIPINYEFNLERHKEKRSFATKVRENIWLRSEWSKALKNVGDGDYVVIQFPVLQRPFLLALAVSSLKRRGGKAIILIHDLEMLRYAMREDAGKLKKLRILFEEKSVLKDSDYIIVHNERMKKKMEEQGFDSSKLIPLEIFDYIVNDADNDDSAITETKVQEGLNHPAASDVIIAGSLVPHKTKYLNELPPDISYALYGIGYEDKGLNNIKYYGAFPPDKLPFVLKGKFGLVWDGDSSDTCSGIYGEYLKINNPHKTSLYLAAGIPVIVWSSAAISKFVQDNKVGLVVDSLYEIGDLIHNMSEQEYRILLFNVKEISRQLKRGTYTMNALSRILKA